MFNRMLYPAFCFFCYLIEKRRRLILKKHSKNVVFSKPDSMKKFFKADAFKSNKFYSRLWMITFVVILYLYLFQHDLFITIVTFPGYVLSEWGP